VTRRRQILLDFCLLFLLATVFLAPYYTHKYTDQWPSIESTFISDARFLVAHWPHPQWQPLWYAGTRFDYIYPPALRYGTAIISKVTGYWTVKAYHFYTIFFYCLGISGVYLLVRVAGRSRAAAVLAAMATGLMSPCFLFLKDMRHDSGPWVPVRFGVLIRYGEGPHITALCLLPIALAFAWRAMEAKRPGSLALAGVFCAAVVSNNFYGASSLAILYPLLLWSFWITRRERRMAFPALAIPLLAYGLTAFWLVPSYLRITLHNMQYVSEKGSTWSILVALATVGIFGFASYKLAGRRPERTWAVFVSGAVVLFAVNVLGHHFLNFRVMGEPGRLIPELDLVFILGAALLLEWLWRHRGPWAKVAVAVVLVVTFAATGRYIKASRHIIQPWPDYKSRVEYRVTDWLWKNMPDARVVPSGTVRFWFDTWHDLAQLTGGSEQGLLNPVVYDAMWEIDAGTDPQFALLWLKALAVDAMYTPRPNSEEPYKDIQRLERFATLPELFNDGQGNSIYGTMRRYAPRVRVVDRARLDSLKRPNGDEDLSQLVPYVDMVENGPDSPATLERQGSDAMLVRARVDAGQSILVQETWDPAWQATVNGRPLPVRKDPLGFMVVDPPPGDDTVHLVFVMPLENRVGWGLTGLSLLALVVLAIRREH
jgi:hypothetical protein